MRVSCLDFTVFVKHVLAIVMRLSGCVKAEMYMQTLKTIPPAYVSRCYESRAAL